MRGSVWVEIDAYITNKNGMIRKSSIETVYGYSSNTELNTNYQRQWAFERALSKTLATYRQNQNLNSDDEVNYHLLNDGIQYTSEGKRTSWRRSRLTPVQKRESHRKVIGKIIIVRREDIAQQYADKKIDIEPKLLKQKTMKEFSKIRKVRKGR